MKSVTAVFSFAGCVLTALVASAGPTWAGLPVPAPLVGVTGPVGLVAAGVAYGGYLLYRRYRSRS